MEATIIYLGPPLLTGSSDQPERAPGKGCASARPARRSIRSCSGWGLPGHKSPYVLVVSYTTVPPLPVPLAPSRAARPSAVRFCGTILQLALTGRYPASRPAEPGLSSRGLAPPAIVCQTSRSSIASIPCRGSNDKGFCLPSVPVAACPVFTGSGILPYPPTKGSPRFDTEAGSASPAAARPPAF